LKTIIRFGIVVISLFALSACAFSENISSTPMIETSTVVSAEIPEVDATSTQSSQSTPTLSNRADNSDLLIVDRATVLKNFSDYLNMFQEMTKTTDWIKKKYTVIYFDNLKKEYRDTQIKEEWYRFDSDEQLIEAYNWVSTLDGLVQQEAVYQNGIWYNITSGRSGNSSNTEVDFTGSFANHFQEGQNIKQEAVTYNESKAWKFSYEIEEGGIRTIEALFFDQQNGLIIGKELYLVQPDRSLQIVSGNIISEFEINAEPPIERFQQMLEQALMLQGKP